MVSSATFYFHDELNDFLPSSERGRGMARGFTGRTSIKDLIEARGVPHAEIELLVANDRSVPFQYIVQDGDVIHVYPRFEVVTMAGKLRLRDPLPQRPAFVLDIHLGRLTAYLRMMGFDALYGDTTNHAEFHDAALARIAHDEGRVLLTRDIGLLKRSIVTYGYWVRSTDPRRHLIEVMRRFELAGKVDLFGRCMKCNGLLHPVEKQAIVDRLPPSTAAHFFEFYQCGRCERVYWRGAHFARMQRLIEDVLRDLKG